MASWLQPPVPANVSDAFDRYWRAVTGNADSAFPAYDNIMRLCTGAMPTHKLQELRRHLRDQGMRDWHAYQAWLDAPNKVEPEEPTTPPETQPAPEPPAPVAATSASETEPAPEAGTVTPEVSTPSE